MSILLFQLVIVSLLIVVRLANRDALVITGVALTVFTIAAVSISPLIAVQLFTIWGTLGLLGGLGATEGTAKAARPTTDVTSPRLETIRPSESLTAAPPSTSGVLPKLNATVEQAERFVREQGLRQKGTAELRLAIHADQTRINGAWESLERHKKIERFLGNSVDRRAAFEKYSAETGAALQESDEADPVQSPDRGCADFEGFLIDANPGVAASVAKDVASLKVEYIRLLRETLTRLRGEPAARPVFNEALTRLGGASLLARLERNEAQWFSRAEPPMAMSARPTDDQPRLLAIRSSRLLIRQAAMARGIGQLVHFTRASNLPSILKHGLRSRAWASKLSTPIHHNDDERLDGLAGAICLSIGHPNDLMLHSLRYRHREEQWVILQLSPAVLWEKSCAFCGYNAADHRERDRPLPERMTAVSLEAMFDDKQDRTSRDERQLMPSDPTDVQAEILVFQPIEARYFTGMTFDDRILARQYQAGGHGIPIAVTSSYRGLFGKREWARMGRS